MSAQHGGERAGATLRLEVGATAPPRAQATRFAWNLIKGRIGPGVGGPPALPRMQESLDLNCRSQEISKKCQSEQQYCKSQNLILN